MTATDRTESRPTIVVGAFLLLSILALTPIFTVGLPPILDYPNHMARMYLLAVLPDAQDLARYYRVVWKPLPDLAFDAVVPPLVHLMPVEAAMRLTLAATLLALAGGCLALHRQLFGRWSAWPLFAFLLLYNRILLWGFLNYLAGLALMLWALTFWLAVERKPFWLRVIPGAIAATAIHLAHLAAFGCYALAILALEAAPRPRPGERFPDRARLRRFAIAAVTLLPAAVLFLAGPTSGASSDHMAYGNYFRKFDLPVSIFDNYSRPFDGATFGVLLLAVIVGLVRRKIVLHARLRWGVLAILVAFFAIPSRLISASGIDHRLPIAVAFLFVAVSDWGSVTPKWRNAVTVALFALLLARMAVVETVWLGADKDYAAMRPALEKIEPGASVAVAAPARDVQAGGVPMLNFPVLAVIDRHAFVNTLFADPHQQPLLFTEAAEPLRNHPPPDALWQALVAGKLPPMAGFNDVILVDPPADFDPASLPGTVLFAAPRIVLLHLPPAQASAPSPHSSSAR